MTKVSIRAHRFSILCAVAAVASLGWSPLQALAADGPTDAIGSTLDATVDPVVTTVSTVSSTVDPVSNTVSSTVDTVSDTVSSSVDTVSDTVSSSVDTVSDTVSSSVDTVSDTVSSSVDTVSGTVSSSVDTVSGTVGDTTTAVADGSVGSDGQADQSTAATGTSPFRSSSGQQVAATGLRSGPHDTAALLADRSGAQSAIGNEGHASCVLAAGTVCETTMTGDTGGSWTRSVAEILRKLLALTGWSFIPWIVALCSFTLVGMLSILRSRDRSGLGSALS